jgi:hypothetical protein
MMMLSPKERCRLTPPFAKRFCPLLIALLWIGRSRAKCQQGKEHAEQPKGEEDDELDYYLGQEKL